MKFVLIVCVIMVSELGLSQISCTQTHFPINDAMTWSNHANVCYGDWDYVEPCIWTWDGSPGLRRGYVDFDIQYINSIVNSDINSMTLDLLNPFSTQWEGYMWIDHHNIFNLCRTIEAWDESTITWNNQPDFSLSEMVQMGPIPINEGVHTNDNITDIDVYNLLVDNAGAVESDYNGIAFIMTTENINNIYQCIGFASKEYVDSSYWPRLNISYTFPEPVVNYDESGVFSVENVDDLELVFDDIEYQWEIQGNMFYGNPVNCTIDCQNPDSSFNLTIRIINSIGDECLYFMDSAIHVVEPFVFQSATVYCENDPEIQLQATPSGGSWSGIGITSSNGMFDPEIAGVGSHTLTYYISDCGGISTNIPITIHPTPELTNIIPSNPVCYAEESGSVTIEGSDLADYSYQWSNGDTTQNIYQIPAGIYDLTVVNTHGCSINASIQVDEPNPINVNLSVDSVYCHFGESGYLFASATGDNPPFNYFWSDGTENDSTEVNGEGWYYVTVADNIGCATSDSIHILIPEFPYNLNIVSHDISCYGMDNGSIEVFASGGFPPYLFVWEAPGNTILSGNNLTQLNPGIYLLNSIDSLGCEIQTQVMIHEPSPIQSALSSTNPSCIGAENGEIVVETTGGTPPYYYQLNELNASLPYFHNLLEGNYVVHVIDSLGCELVQTVTLVDNPIECIRIPNAFTPNNDDNNDTWIIENIDMFNHWIVKVFNRWGQLIYTGTPADDPWDGRTAAGKLVPTGSYLYTLQGHNLPEDYCGIVSVVY